MVINPDGTFVYTPSAALAATGGTDVFKVKVADTGVHLHGLFGSHSTTATVTVTVKPINTVIDTIDVGDGPTDVVVSPTAPTSTSPTRSATRCR